MTSARSWKNSKFGCLFLIATENKEVLLKNKTFMENQLPVGATATEAKKKKTQKTRKGNQAPAKSKSRSLSEWLDINYDNRIPVLISVYLQVKVFIRNYIVIVTCTVNHHFSCRMIRRICFHG